MNLTPIDVEQKAFTQALRGYQMDEVDDFLDEVVATLRSYDQRLRDAQDKIKAMESEASARGGDESAISRAILTAQRSADALIAEAEAEAAEIRKKAIAETDELLAARDNERTRILEEIGGMRGLMDGLRGRLAEMARTVAGSVERMDEDIDRTREELSTGPAAAAGAPPVSEDSPAGIFPEEDRLATVDLSETDAPPAEEAVSRVGARPWERG